MTYRKDIDLLKGIAILAIVFFHLGLLDTGYLGVDVFFVISGFLILPRICSELTDGSFQYFPFIQKRLLRWMPLVVVASFVCMIVGFWGMLPDSYENLAESVVASNVYAENVLSAITAGSYWNISNDYKPLMHLWYLGVLFQFYLLCPLILKGGLKLIKKPVWMMACLCGISLLLYLLPIDFEGNKFYYLHYRAFEILLGGIAGCLVRETKEGERPISHIIALVGIILILVSSLLLQKHQAAGSQVIPIGMGGQRTISNSLAQGRPLYLLLTVTLTAFFLLKPAKSGNVAASALAFVGKRSFSIYVWHQVILAFYRYFFSKSVSVWFVLLFLLAVFIVSELSYRFIEKKDKANKRSFLLWVAASALITLVSFGIYLRAGVVRDVPELSISAKAAHRGMHSEYIDRSFQLDREFPPENGKINVLVEGMSFARDFVNCLLESAWADSLNISYVYSWDDTYLDRIRQADVIFTFRGRDEVPAYVTENMSRQCQLWGIGTKNYGECNGVFYRRRHSYDFKNTTVAIPVSYISLNNRWKKSWGDHYIDFIQMSEVSPGVVRVFTPEGKFISQDCEHFTPDGARWFASRIPWPLIF